MLMRTAFTSALATLVLALLATAPCQADGVQVILRGSRIKRVVAGNTTLDAPQLAAGVSSGAVQFKAVNFDIGAADDRDLATYFARNNVAPEWDMDLGVWTDQGDGYDFFLFEVGGNNSITVQPRFIDGSLGQPATISGWTGTGYSVQTGSNAGQEVFGLAFAADQLKRADGGPLPVGVTIAGLRISSGGIDGAALLAHRPDPTAGVDGDGSVHVAGVRRVGQLVELQFSGPWASETDNNPNPFLDYRLSVGFTGPDGTTIEVPGFFDADGEGGEWGTRWAARFRPPYEGTWVARAKFRAGNDIAILPQQSGTPGLLEGVVTVLEVAPIDPTAPGFLRYGTLRYVDDHYMKFDHGPYFLEVGVNSPENLLAFRGFDGVAKMPASEGVLHSFAPHVADWREGDPLFVSQDHRVDSKGLIGALNYLSDVGLNSIFAMPMNLGGDGQDVHPFLGLAPTGFDRTHYDTGRLRQWHQVFEHAAQRGILIHLTLGETETDNEEWLDGGAFGVERKLFLRELIARFADSPALVWDLSEENDFSVSVLRAKADWIRDLDPYQHPVTFHNHLFDFDDYDEVLGEERFEQTALQFAPDWVDTHVEQWRKQSAVAGQPWVVAAVEHSPWQEGLTDQNHDDLRKRVLYDVLLSGGHLQWYAGWHDLPLGGDLSLEDFRTREEMWEDSAHALAFLRSFPFHEMSPKDALVSGGDSSYGGAQCFEKPGEVYLVYLPDAGGAPTLDLTGASGPFQLFWFDPREGEWIGKAKNLVGGGTVSLGPPPHSPGEDWLVAVTKRGSLSADTWALSASAGGTQTLTLALTTSDAGRRYQLLGSMSGDSPGFSLGSVVVPLNFDRYTRIVLESSGGPLFPNGSGVVPLSGRIDLQVVLPPGAFAPLIGTTLHHAVVLVDPYDFATSAVPLQILP